MPFGFAKPWGDSFNAPRHPQGVHISTTAGKEFWVGAANPQAMAAAFGGRIAMPAST